MLPSEDFLIDFSPAHRNVVVSSACSGHGFKYAPLYGQFAEEWLNQKPSPELEAFSIAKRARPATNLGDRA